MSFDLTWVTHARLDWQLDRSTWLRMAEECDGLGVTVRVLASHMYRVKRGAGDSYVHYLPRIQVPLMHVPSFNATAAIALVHQQLKRPPRIVVFEPWTMPAVLPAVLLTRIRSVFGRKHSRFVLDVRTLSVAQGHGVRHYANEVAFALGVRMSNFFVAGVSAITPSMLDILRSEYGLRSTVPTRVWSSGVDVNLFRVSSETKQRARELRVDLGFSDRVVFLYHGNVAMNRGLDRLVEAVAIVARGGLTDFCVAVLGDGPDMERLEAVVRTMGVSTWVALLPRVELDEVPSYIEMADAGVIPLTNWRGWRVSSPLKLLEYLALCKPVVLTPIQAHTDVLSDTEMGIFAGSDSPSDLACALVAACQLGRSGLARRGRHGRALVEQTYAWRKQAEALTAFCRKLVGNTRP